LATETDRIGLILDRLTAGLFPFFEREMTATYGEHWLDQARTSFRTLAPGRPDSVPWDAHALLTVMWDHWNQVFRTHLSIFERSLVSELREFRNRWAHQAAFTEDDSFRVCDSAQRLLRAARADEAADALEEIKIDILRERFGRKVNSDLARIRFNRERISDIVLYTICCLAINTAAFMLFGSRNLLPATLMAAFVFFTFGYFIFQRLNAAMPTYGVHECQRCRRIVYSELCPYCEPAQRPPETIKPA
jgi:hypothetical protein